MDPWLSCSDKALASGKALDKVVEEGGHSIGYKHLNQFAK